MDLDGLHPWCRDLLHTMGLPDPATDQQARRFQLQAPHATPSDERALAVHLTDRQNSTLGHHRARAIAGRLLASVLDDVATWADLHAQGTPTFEIAERCSAPVVLVELALHGPRGPHRAHQAADVRQAWADGGTRAEVAASIGLSVPAFRTWCRDAHFELAPRWTTTTIATVLGCSTHQARAMHARGQLPTPDGYTGLKGWWWPATINAWREQQLAAGTLLPCPTCGALLPSRKGVSLHQAHMHPR